MSNPRHVLFIPLEEVERYFAVHTRQDVKIVAPEIRHTETPLTAGAWRNSAPDEPNLLCLSSDFPSTLLPHPAAGPFAISFANERAAQDAHYHEHHIEIYYSASRMTVEFWNVGETERNTRTVDGGAIVFGPLVAHKVTLTGLTMVIELPSVPADKKTALLG